MSEATLERLRSRAMARGIPIVSQSCARFLEQMVKLSRIDVLVEAGSAIGYSALRVALHTPDLKIVGYEKQAKLAEEATRHAGQFKVADRVRFVAQPAESAALPLPEGPIGGLFIDAAKASYLNIFETFEPYLAPGAFVLADNASFKGLDPERAAPRHRRLIERMQQFNERLLARPGYDVARYDIGDGLLLAIKVED